LRFGAAAAEVGREAAALDLCLGSPEWVFLEPRTEWPQRPAAGSGRWARARAGLAAAFPWAGVRWGGVCLLGLVFGACGMILFRAHPTWETAGWDWLFASGFVGLAFLTVIVSYRFYLGWKGVERLAAAILAVPMAGAFDHLPDKVSRLFGRYLLASRRRLRDRDVLLYLRDRAVAAMEAANTGQAAAVLRAYEDWEADEARRAADRAAEPVPPRGPDPELEEDDVADLCRLSARLVGCLIPVWAADGRPIGVALGTVPVEPGKESPEPGGWVGRAEQFVALMAVVFLSQYLVRMRRLAVMAAVTSGALLTAATAYQFQPEGLIMTGGLLLSGGVTLLILWVLLETNRNELVSRVCRSTPHRFSLDSAFVSNVVTLVLPLVLVVAAQFAGRTRAVVEPILGWFH
ncbi:MAG TPA: hypothetical protein VH092_28090, partial [Urbifossiella sp.]|nr:hypothetical protein [Urbifossiella sp.]